MNMEERIARINELYHKSQNEGLTDAEKEEQARLRKEYVENIRANLRGQLESITIEHPDGTRESVKDRKQNSESLQTAGKWTMTGGREMDNDRRQGNGR